MCLWAGIDTVMISGMRAYVGVTDGEWFRYLAAHPDLNEVNFWRPGGPRAFHSLSAGEPFIFKTHASDGNRLVGGGFFSGAPDVGMRVSEAWEYFGPGNGASTMPDLLARIQRYRRNATPESDPLIGCLFLRDVRFFSADATLPAPDDFAPNLVQGRSYDLANLDVSHAAWRAYALMLGWTSYDLEETTRVVGPMFGVPALTVPRLGQQSFKSLVLTSYRRRCAITGDRIQPVLEAAHIRPIEHGGEHRLDNGLLLRSDAHTLFDRGYLAIDTEHRLRVSPLLRSRWENGDEFYRREGEVIALPDKQADRPSRDFVEWHNDAVFKAC